MNVLVIPEDFRKDQYILKPLLSRLFRTIGASSVRVRVCQDPLLGGIGEALKLERLREIVQQYEAMTDIFVLCVDRDGVTGRRYRLNEIETEFGDIRPFFAENAWEEVEIWVLAGLKLPRSWRWADVRAEVHVKERYFEPLVSQRGLSDAPGGGRRSLGEQASHRLGAIRQKCPEDFDALAMRIEAVVQG